jgi:hypothetical protein
MIPHEASRRAGSIAKNRPPAMPAITVRQESAA